MKSDAGLPGCAGLFLKPYIYNMNICMQIMHYVLYGYMYICILSNNLAQPGNPAYF